MTHHTRSVLSLCLTLAAARGLGGCAPSGDEAAASTSAIVGPLSDSSWGANNEGGGIALGSIDGDPRPDVVFARVDAPSGDNFAYFRIGWNVSNVNTTGGAYEAASFGNVTQMPGGIGYRTSGAGVALGDVDRNGRPDLVFVYVDDPSGADVTYYRIGWNLDTAGRVSSWSERKTFTGGFHGHHTAGADVALADLDGNGRLEMAVALVDDPSGDNTLYASLGWNLDTSGNVSSYGPTMAKPGWVGHTTADVGLAFADMNHNGVPDLVTSWVDAPAGPDVHYVQTVYEPGRNRTYTRWSPRRRLGDVAEDVQAAGAVVRDFDGDGSLDVWSFTLGEVGGVNTAALRMDFARSDRDVRIRNYLARCAETAFLPDETIQLYSNGTCNDTRNNQVFTFAQADGGGYVVLNSDVERGAQCLNIGPSFGGTSQVIPCDGTSSQRWTFVDPDGDGVGQIRNTGSGYCLVPRTDTLFGSSHNQARCDASANQQFDLTLVL